MPDEGITRQLLTTGARKLVDTALQKQNETRQPILGVNHWLLALIDQHAAMAEAMVAGFRPEQVKNQVIEKLKNGDPGAVLSEGQVVQEAVQRARSRERAQAGERDLAAVILIAAGYALIQGQTAVPTLNGAVAEIGPSRAAKATPALDQFGRDLTQAARAGKLCGLVGREEELSLMIETLCRRTKRNPVLVGPAGVGKTAIVEGLAQRVVVGKVPAPLQGARMVALQPSSLVAGAHMSGELEKRMKAILQEASQEGILLFIDEIHTIMGAGGMLGTTDVSSMLKPALARGDIACIAATTDDEYRRYIENDTALERRFQPIRVNELPPEQTLEVLRSLREELRRENPVDIGDDVLKWLIDFSQQFMRNRYFPDKAVDLLEQCFAHALARGKTTVDLSDARAVAQRMVGMPVVSSERLAALEKEMKDRRLLTDEEAQILVNRLQVTLRGLDMRASRPNAVVLLGGEAAENSQAFAETMASLLFGAVDRVITIDCSRFNQPEDITMLLGAPPGYVGYSDRLPIHRLLQIPWSVLLLERVDACHPHIREVLGQALTDGWLVDGRGKTIYLSDTIVVLTSMISTQEQRGLGFKPETGHITAEELFRDIVARIGAQMADQIDLLSMGVASVDAVSIDWLKDHFLADLCGRYMKQGIKLTWDNSFLEWLAVQQDHYSEHDWEIWVDRYLTPVIIPFLPSSGSNEPITLQVQIQDTSVKVLALTTGG